MKSITSFQNKFVIPAAYSLHKNQLFAIPQIFLGITCMNSKYFNIDLYQLTPHNIVIDHIWNWCIPPSGKISPQVGLAGCLPPGVGMAGQMAGRAFRLKILLFL